MLEIEPQGFWGGNRHFGTGAEEIRLPNGWKPRWYQQKTWDALTKTHKKRVYMICHRRWGKDDVALHYTATAAHNRVGNYWHCLPQYSQARKAIWTAVNPHTGKRRIDEAFPHQIRKKTLESEMYIEFLNGSSWQLVGSDNYDKLVGAGTAGIVFSEWALCNPAAYGYMQPMLVENDGWALFISTPRGRNFAYDLFRRAQDDPQWHVELQDVTHTKAMSQAALDDALADYKALYGEDVGTNQFRQEYLCDWNAAILGSYYALECRKVRAEGRIRPVACYPGAPVHRAWDLGMKDDMAIIWFQVVNGKVIVLDYYGNNSAGIEHYAEVIEKRGWPLADAIDWVPHDAKIREMGTGRTRIESMIKFGLNPRLAPMASKEDGIEAARRTLGLTVFNTKVEDNLFAALEQYRRKWDDEKKTFSASEVRDWTTHPSDAFRYLSLAWRVVTDTYRAKKKKQPKGSVVLEGPPKAQRKNRIVLNG